MENILRNYAVCQIKMQNKGDSSVIADHLRSAGLWSIGEEKLWPVLIKRDVNLIDIEQHNKRENAALMQKVRCILEHTTRNMGIRGCFVSDAADVYGLVFFPLSRNDTVFLKKLHHCLIDVQMQISKDCHITCSVGIGLAVFEEEQLSVCYETAKRALDYRLFSGKASIHFLSKISQHKGFRYDQFNIKEFERRIRVACVCSDTDEIYHLADEIFNKILKSSYDLDYAENTCQLIQYLLYCITNEWNPNYIVVSGTLEGYYIKLTTIETLEERAAYFVQLCSSFENIFGRIKLKGTENPQIKKAILFLFHNYYRDITLKEVAEYVNLSPAYFSSFFKENIGKSFKDFVNHLRVEKAEEYLLYTEFSILEIAGMIGFVNAKHFSTVFKHHYGISPSSFRKSHRNQ